MTVLVVDDNQVALRLCRRVLEKAGHTVLTASDGLEGVSLALANSPDFILMDVAMPGMDGIEAMRRIKEQRPGIPIVVASAHLRPSDRERFLALGAADMLIPPFRLNDLIELVARFTASGIPPAKLSYIGAPITNVAAAPKSPVARIEQAAERRITIPEELRRIVGQAEEVAFWRSHFPISTANGKPGFDLGKAARSVADFLVALTEISPLLDALARHYGALGDYVPVEQLDSWSRVHMVLGTALVELPRRARLAAKKSSSRLFALAQSIAFETSTASKEQRDWSWSGAERMFATYEAPAMDSLSACNWDELIQGKYVHEFADEGHALIELLQRLIVSPPKPNRPADEIRRPGSAHEEHVYGAYRWCAVCGWIELMAAPIGIHTLITTPPGRTAARSVAKLEDQALELVDQALRARDPYTASHSSRVEDLAGRLALQLKLGARDWDLFRKAGALHDIGKIGIPDQILQKPGRLSDEEWTIMRRHSDIGADLIEKSSALREIASLVRHHHERWDGSGYPKRMKGNAIPLGARIIAVAESFDWLTHPPSFLRPPMDVHEALRDIRKRSGSWYDPEVVTALREIHRAHQS